MLDIERIRTTLAGIDFVSSVIYLDEIESTNEYCSSPEIPIDTLIITDNQTAGKGRNQKKWVSEKNSNLTFSIKKKLNISPSENQSVIRFFSYYVYITLLEELAKSKTQEKTEKDLIIKWPNDILHKGRKLCGILTEAKLPSDVYVIGIGINCNQLTFPSGLNATSLREIFGVETNISALLVKLIHNFSCNFEQLKPENLNKLFEKWKSAANIIGINCEFTLPNGILNSGQVIDLNYDGSISVLINGKIEKYYSGDLRLTFLN